MANLRADVVVIGGGANGASAAMHLAKQGAGKVVLVEKGHISSGATGRSGAMIREHYPHPTLARIAHESSHIYHNFPDAIGGDARFRQTGRVLVFGEMDRAAVELNVAMNRDLGINITTISAEDVRKLVPQAAVDDVAIGVWEPESGYADPVATTYSYVEEARRHGAEVLANTPVTGFQVQSGRLAGVLTTEGVIETRTALNAAGAWGNLVGGLIGDLFPITPIRVQMVHMRRPPSFGPLDISFIDHTTEAYFRADGGDYTLVGGEAPIDMAETVNPNSYGLNADHDVILRFWERARRRFPAFDSAICRGGYGSLYDMTPDANPILDRSPLVEGLYWAVGFSGHGFKLSPVVGRMVAEFIIHGQAKGYDIGEFRLSRFHEGDLLLPEHPYSSMGHQ